MYVGWVIRIAFTMFYSGICIGKRDNFGFVLSEL